MKQNTVEVVITVSLLQLTALQKALKPILAMPPAADEEEEEEEAPEETAAEKKKRLAAEKKAKAAAAAKAKKAKKEEEEEDEDEDEDDDGEEEEMEISLETAKEVARRVIKAKKSKAMKEVLDTYGLSRITDIDEDDEEMLSGVIGDLVELLD